jgi:hypothetical protein
MRFAQREIIPALFTRKIELSQFLATMNKYHVMEGPAPIQSCLLSKGGMSLVL